MTLNIIAASSLTLLGCVIVALIALVICFVMASQRKVKAESKSTGGLEPPYPWPSPEPLPGSIAYKQREIQQKLNILGTLPNHSAYGMLKYRLSSEIDLIKAEIVQAIKAGNKMPYDPLREELIELENRYLTLSEDARVNTEEGRAMLVRIKQLHMEWRGVAYQIPAMRNPPPPPPHRTIIDGEQPKSLTQLRSELDVIYREYYRLNNLTTTMPLSLKEYLNTSLVDLFASEQYPCSGTGLLTQLRRKHLSELTSLIKAIPANERNGSVGKELTIEIQQLTQVLERD